MTPSNVVFRSNQFPVSCRQMKEKFADRLLPVSVFGMGVRMDAVPFFTSLRAGELFFSLHLLFLCEYVYPRGGYLCCYARCARADHLGCAGAARELELPPWASAGALA